MTGRNERPALRRRQAKAGRRSMGKGLRLPGHLWPLAPGGHQRAVPSSGPTSLYTGYRGGQGASETLGAPTGYADGQPPGSRDPHPGLAFGQSAGTGVLNVALPCRVPPDQVSFSPRRGDLGQMGESFLSLLCVLTRYLATLNLRI